VEIAGWLDHRVGRGSANKSAFILPYPQEGKMKDPKDVYLGKKSIASVLPFLVVMAFVLSCTAFEAATPLPTDTPLPTETETLAPTDTELPTDTPEPTKKATVNKAATQRANEAKTEAAQTEFAGAVLGEVESKLDDVGEIMGYGSVIWMYPPSYPVKSSQANMIYYKLLDSSIQAADFAFHSVVKWETEGNQGIVNCVIMFRTGEDISLNPWYSLRLSRISGASSARFDLWQNWSVLTPNSEWRTSNYIRDGNGDENEVILIARGNEMKVYVNTKRVNVWWNSKLTSGGFGLGTLQDYGTTTCTFSENWIWEWAN
jgi:hypothetical protein